MGISERVLGCVVAIPCVAATLIILAVSVAERSGASFLHAPVPANLAEAAATGRADDVVRRLRAGEEPHHVYALRPEAISSTVLRATTMEAAMWSRQVRMIELLDREGAIRSDERLALTCLASDLDASDIVDYLSNGAPPTCTRSEAYDRVLARTPQPVDD